MTEVTTYFKPPRVEKRKKRMRSERERDERYLELIRRLPCLATGLEPAGCAAHVRMSSGVHNKRNTPMGQKPDDRWALPLTHEAHMKQHQVGERTFWNDLGINPVQMCAELYARRGDFGAMRQVVMNHLGRNA